MQATTLGSYLLYTPARKFLAARGDGSVAPADQPSAAADWRVTQVAPGVFVLSPASQPDRVLSLKNGDLTVVPRASAGYGSRFAFALAAGCAVYPEAQLNATGTPSRGKTSWGEVGGFLEGHNHWMNFEFLGGDFQCGRPWHAYGIPYAFPDCSSVEGPKGTAAPVQNFLNYGQPAQPHDTTGWPKFTEWANHNLTYDGVYWRWVERAWMSGLRLMVMPINENRILCGLIAKNRNSCNEMDAVRLALRDVRELQRYVDAQAGGPGKGFFQIVTTPEKARRVINEGKMAVVLEVEVSELFDCRGWETSTCDKAQIDRQLNEVYGLGVRSSLLLNKFDNPLTGVRFDSGPVGVLINGGNHQSAGSFWSAETCRGRLHDNEIYTPTGPAGPFLAGVLAQLGVTGGTVPTYPPAPHCNTRGLTELGRHLERRMIQKHMIINPDHMGQKAVDDTLTLLEAKHYSGVISPHGWMDPGNWPRIWKLGGLAFPDSDTSNQYVQTYAKYRPRQTPYMLGWGYGADLGGLAAQPDARANSVHYPFKSYDGKVTLSRQRSGDRTFDYNKDGVAHYGLYADWFQDVRNLGGATMAADMWRGAEAYLEMWERADGIRAPGCRQQDDGLTAAGLGPVHLGDSWESLLRRAGQPQQRTRVWTWCAVGRRNGTAANVAELNTGGKVELAGSTAYGRGALGVEVGSAVKRVRGVATGVGQGLFVRRAGGAVFVWSVLNGHVKTVGVATRGLARRPRALRAAMKRVARAHASQAKRVFIPNATPGSARLTGASLVGTSDPRLNRALAVICGYH
jgi:rhodanese-related sulfurtransferase